MFETGRSSGSDGSGAGSTMTAADLERLVQTVPAPTEWQFEVGGRLLFGDHRTRDPHRVIAVAERATVTPELIAAVWDIDARSLDRDGRVGLSAVHDRINNATAAKRAQAVAATVAVTPSADKWICAEQVAAADLGAALALGAGGSNALLATSVALVDRLPDTNAAALAGDLSWTKVSILADAVAPLADEQARAVEARVLPRAAVRTPAQHRAAVRRAVDRIDPAGAEERRRTMRAEVRLVRQHLGDGMGELYATMTSEQLETTWAGADHWARRAKAAGDQRTLDQLRVAALVHWAQSFLTHGDPTYCDQHCDNAPPSKDIDAEPASRTPAPATPPSRQGRSAVVAAEWDLTSLLGLTKNCGRLTASDASLPPEAVRELITGGVRVRRVLIDPANGHLVDLSPRTWRLEPADGRAHGQPVELRLIVNGPPGASSNDELLRSYDVAAGLPADVRAAIDALADEELVTLLRDLLAAPITAITLDDKPDAPIPSAALAAFTNLRDAHPVNPTAGLSDAAGGDIDHNTPRSQGGKTTRANTASLTRRWHVLKTHADWTVQRIGPAWEWTSPTGRKYRTEPHDYRLGP